MKMTDTMHRCGKLKVKLLHFSLILNIVKCLNKYTYDKYAVQLMYNEDKKCWFHNCSRALTFSELLYKCPDWLEGGEIQM